MYEDEQHEHEIIRLSKLTKRQLWKNMSEHNSWDFVNEKKDAAYHFIRCIKEQETKTAKKTQFFARKGELGFEMTHKAFADYEVKFRHLIEQTPVLHSDVLLDFAESVVTNKTVKARRESFFGRANTSQLMTDVEFTAHEKKHREFLLEEKSTSIESLAKKLERHDKRPLILKIQGVLIEEHRSHLKSWAKQIPQIRKESRERELLATGRGFKVKRADGTTEVREKTSFKDKALSLLVAGIVIVPMLYSCATYLEEVSKKNDHAECRKYGINDTATCNIAQDIKRSSR